MNKIRRNKVTIFALTMPGLALYLLFIIVPLVMTIYGGFFEGNMVEENVFVGVANYRELAHDPLFRNALRNSAVSLLMHIVLGIIPVVVVGVLLQNAPDKLQSFLSAAFLYPLILAVVVVAKMWVQIYNPEIGLINSFLRLIGLKNVQPLWLNDSRYSLVLVIFVALWQWFGYGVVIVLASVKSIPRHYIEAARIDGANNLQTFFRVTLPLMEEKLKIIFIMYVVGGITTFTHNMIMTNGGPGTSSTTILMYIYKTVFSAFRFGYGIAMSTVLLVCCLTGCLLINAFVAREKVEL